MPPSRLGSKVVAVGCDDPVRNLLRGPYRRWRWRWRWHRIAGIDLMRSTRNHEAERRRRFSIAGIAVSSQYINEARGTSARLCSFVGQVPLVSTLYLMH